MRKKKFYAVRVGRKTGIFFNKKALHKAIENYPGAQFKGFYTKQAAIKYMNYTDIPIKLPKCNYCFVDGSYNKRTNTYGWGGFLINQYGKRFILRGSSKKHHHLANIAGELTGALRATEMAYHLGMKMLTIYHDFDGINIYENESSNTNSLIKNYHKEMHNFIEKGMKLYFIHVKSHDGIDGNEEADQIAREACGILKERKK